MARLLITDTTLTAIADAIREKLNTDADYAPGEMPAAIAGISAITPPSGGNAFSRGAVIVDSAFFTAPHISAMEVTS